MEFTNAMARGNVNPQNTQPYDPTANTKGYAPTYVPKNSIQHYASNFSIGDNGSNKLTEAHAPSNDDDIFSTMSKADRGNIKKALEAIGEFLRKFANKSNEIHGTDKGFNLDSSLEKKQFHAEDPAATSQLKPASTSK